MIKDIPLNERPREKLISKGVENLTDGELLSIILKTGKKGKSVNDLANELITKYQSINILSNLSLKELCEISGIGEVKAMELIVSFEIGKRITKKNLKKIQTSHQIYELFFSKIAFKEQEELHAIYLDYKNQIIISKLISIGTVNQSQINPRDIYREALKVNATGIVLVHNHPSGDFTPSSSDRELTNHIKKNASTIGLKLIDHIIIGYTNYYSFNDKEW